VILFGHLLPHSSKALIADFAFVVSTPIGITIAFLCYKHFVFRTHGNYLKEWLRCFAVYSVTFPMGLHDPSGGDERTFLRVASDAAVCAVSGGDCELRDYCVL
jgi:hypothetical protein